MKNQTSKNSNSGSSSNKKGMTKNQMMAVGGAAAAAIAAGAGAYYLMGPKGKAHQRKTKMMLSKMIKEAEMSVEKAKDMTQPLFHNTIDALATKYSNQYNAHEMEIRALASKLKSAWNKKTSTVMKRTAKRPARRTSKKSSSSKASS